MHDHDAIASVAPKEDASLQEPDSYICLAASEDGFLHFASGTSLSAKWLSSSNQKKEDEMKRSMLLASAGALLLAAPSFAAETPRTDGSDPQMLIELEDDNVKVEPFNISADELEDMNIEDSNGEVIGEVEEVLSTKDGKIAGISTEVGGYLGVGDREVILGLDQVELKDGKLVTSLTEAEIEKLPNRG